LKQSERDEQNPKPSNGKGKEELDYVTLLNVLVSASALEAHDSIPTLNLLPTLGSALLSLRMHFPKNLRLCRG